MDGNGGCCVVGHAGNAYRMSKMDKIMLRFRPIAPKPDYGLAPVGVSMVSGDLKTSVTRKKRRYCGGVDKRSCGRRRKSSSTRNDKMAVNTLPLLPETPDVKETTASVELNESYPFNLSLGQHVSRFVLDDPAGRKDSAKVGSWVKVECVADKWLDMGMGRSNMEKLMNLDIDTCPAFVSDCLNRVRWTNAAYRNMVAGESVEVMVEEGMILPIDCTAFTCRVKLMTSIKDNKYLILPADIWKMDNGGFAWRLDTKAALSLGL